MAESAVDQSELARRLGIKSQAVNQWVQGHTVPSSRRFEDIARALNIPVGRVLDWKRAPAGELNAQEVADLPHKLTELDVLAIWRAIDDDGKRALMTVGHTIAKASAAKPPGSKRFK